MVDNRSAGFFGIGGAFNFKSGDISGTAAKTQDDKMGQGTEYGVLEGEEQEQGQKEAPYVDRSARLSATLNSLAMMNVASVLNERKLAGILNKANNPKLAQKEDSEEKETIIESKEDLDEEFLNDFDESEDQDNEYY